MKTYRFASFFVVALALANLMGCGGGSNNSAGGSASHTPTVTLTATPTSTSTGASVTLAWTATNAASVSIDNGVGTVSTNAAGTVSPSSSGTVTVYPLGTTTWTATAIAGMGWTGSATATATVNVTSNGAALILYYSNNATASVVESDGTGAVQIASNVYDPTWFANHQSFIAVDNLNPTGSQFDIFTTSGSATSTKLQSTISVAPLVNIGLPTPSPDGKTIIFIGFSSNLYGHQGIYAVKADGTGFTTTPLYQNPNTGSGIALGQPRWSHDGKYIVHNRIDTSGRSTVWVMNADGTNPRQVTNIPNANTSDGAFSLDDGTIFFDQCPSSCQIWKIASAGTVSTETLVVNGAVFPVPSPDGKSLVYIGPGISVSDVNGNNQKQIVANGGDPSW